MNVLILTETYYPLNTPTAKCVEKLICHIKNENSIYIVCKANKKEHFINDNLNIITIKSYYNKVDFKLFEWFSYKIFQKIYKIFKPFTLFDTNRLLKESKKIFKDNKISVVIAVSGWFSSQMCAAKLYKKYRIPFFSWYVDPFLNNIGYKKYSVNKLKNIELKWLAFSSCAFMPSCFLPIYSEFYGKNILGKIKILELPCYFDIYQNKILKKGIVNEKSILYAGTFTFRDCHLDILFGIISQLPDFIFTFLSDDNIDFSRFSNVKKIGRLYGQDYLETYSKNQIVLVIDNDYGIQVPSKVFEAISSCKPIIFVYSNENSIALNIMLKYQGIYYVKIGENLKIDTMKLNSIINKTYDRKYSSNENLMSPLINMINFYEKK